MNQETVIYYDENKKADPQLELQICASHIIVNSSTSLQLTLPLIRQWRVIKLNISGNKMGKHIIKEISHIKFPNLTRLNLFANQIQSIEGLCRTHIPNLQILDLGRNKITFIKNLRKAQFLTLKNIWIYQNFINEGSWLTEMNLETIYELTFQFLLNNNKNCEDISWLGKINGNSLKILGKFMITVEIRGSQRIRQSSIQNAIKEKLLQIEIRERYS